MSEKTLAELVEIRLEIDAWRAYKHEQQPWIAMFGARIRRAEAAEALAEAYTAWIHSRDLHLLKELATNVKKYEAAREAVRKMEDGT